MKSLAGLIEAVESATGIDIEVCDGMGDAKGPPDEENVLDALPTIRKVLLGYPSPAIRGSLLKKVRIYGKFQMGGTPFLGSAIAKDDLLNLAIRDKTSLAQLESTMHHEIAHLIELHPSFRARDWTDESGPYSGELQGQDRETLESYYEKGFVTRYASKNRYEDFAEMAEMANDNPKKLKELAKTYPRIEAKVALMKHEYARYGLAILE